MFGLFKSAPLSILNSANSVVRIACGVERSFLGTQGYASYSAVRELLLIRRL